MPVPDDFVDHKGLASARRPVSKEGLVLLSRFQRQGLDLFVVIRFGSAAGPLDVGVKPVPQLLLRGRPFDGLGARRARRCGKRFFKVVLLKGPFAR